MLTSGLRQTCRNQSRQCHALDGLVFQLGTEHQLLNINVIVVVLQFIENIERRIETRITDVGVQTTASIHGKAEGVDIEVTFYLTRYNINALVQRTRSLLITETTLSSKFCRQVLQNVIRCITIEGESFYLRCANILTRVIHQ